MVGSRIGSILRLCRSLESMGKSLFSTLGETLFLRVLMSRTPHRFCIRYISCCLQLWPCGSILVYLVPKGFQPFLSFNYFRIRRRGNLREMYSVHRGSNPTRGALLFYPPFQSQFNYFRQIFWSTLRFGKPEFKYSARIILAFSADSYSLLLSTLADATKTTFKPHTFFWTLATFTSQAIRI